MRPLHRRTYWLSAIRIFQTTYDFLASLLATRVSTLVDRAPSLSRIQIDLHRPDGPTYFLLLFI